MPNTPIPKTLPEKVIELTGYADAALTKAAEQLAAYEQRSEKIATLIPAVVDSLVDGERILDNEEQRKQAAAILQDPARTLELLQKVAVHRNAAERTLGTGATKQAGASPSYDSMHDPRPGLRTTMVKESSRRLFQRLGLNPPTSE